MDTETLTRPALQMTGIGKRFPGVVALDDVSLSLEPGQVHALMGENGAGKSTLIKILAGVYLPDEGTIHISGEAVDLSSPRDALARGIKVVFQEIALIDEFTVAENLFLGEYPTGPLGSIKWRRIEEEAAALFDRVGFAVDPRARVRDLPVSQQQMVEIARALAAEARILILDEPVSALDVSVQAQVLNLLADLKARLDLTYLFISHDLAVVEAVSDRIAVLYFGSVVELGRAEDIFASPRHPYTRLLADSAPVVGRPLKAPEGHDTDLPDPLNPPSGCAFRARCPYATQLCADEVPRLTGHGGRHDVACHHPLSE